jgi:DNA processing protein
MGFDAITVDMLVERTGLTTEVVSSILLMLELQGDVSSTAGGLYIRLPERV